MSAHPDWSDKSHPRIVKGEGDAGKLLWSSCGNLLERELLRTGECLMTFTLKNEREHRNPGIYRSVSLTSLLQEKLNTGESWLCMFVSGKMNILLKIHCFNIRAMGKVHILQMIWSLLQERFMQIISINRISQCKSFLVNMRRGLGNVMLMICLFKGFLMFLQFQMLFFPTLIYITEEVTANLLQSSVNT